MINSKIEKVTASIAARSKTAREAYLLHCKQMHEQHRSRAALSCTNLAHSYAAADNKEKVLLRNTQQTPNIGIVTAYNDMLSAHQPYGQYPDLIKKAAIKNGATAQVAGGVPAMCDGVTQGQPGMELSLFSRDIIAQATAIALSHHVFDGVTLLGICDKIVPGLLMGALSFGHLPSIFIPAGPMPSGISNDQKAKTRVAFAEGNATQDDLLRSEEKAYHSAGTCTFFGTANSNQMLLEMMGLQLPSSSFFAPNSPERTVFTHEAVNKILFSASHSQFDQGLGPRFDVRNLVNGVIGLLATGGSTNHTLHLVAIARSAGWILGWEDLAQLSSIVPLITRIYPNGSADVNQFHQAGGMATVIAQLLESGLLYEDIRTVNHTGMSAYANRPTLSGEGFSWQPAPIPDKDHPIVRSCDTAFSEESGLQLVTGNLGKAIIKTSAIPASSPTSIAAPAKVFSTQQSLMDAYDEGKLKEDFIAVLPGQGPSANGMPELHKLSPPLTSLQNQGLQVAILTDGRMSGASGKIPAAIHVTPEAVKGGLIGLIKDGDTITIDWQNGIINVEVSDEQLSCRQPFQLENIPQTLGRDLFTFNRANVSPSDKGASYLFN